MSLTDDASRRTDRRFYVTGGTLRLDAPSYVVRRADAELHEGLTSGEFCYILTARQMGKSSLIVRTAARLRQEGIAVVVLDLSALGQNVSPEQWYDGLREHVGEYLDLEAELEAFWQEHARVSPLQRWMRALRQVVLARIPGRVVIFIDEIDVVRSLPFSTDEFFAAIRECYNRRSEDPDLERLTFCLVGVATPADLIQDTRTTPFNIGRRIELADFTEAEASPLSAGLIGGADFTTETRRHGEEHGGKTGEEARALLRRVLHWTGGHPYLTQRLCRAIAGARGAEEPSAPSPCTSPCLRVSVVKSSAPNLVDRSCEELFLSPRARERDDNLLFVRERLLRGDGDLAGLLELYARVRAGKPVRDDETNPLLDVLRLAGIVRVERDRLVPRNRIYAHVFDLEWVRRNMPDAEVRRQRAAFRRGLIRAGGAAGVLIAVLSGLAGYAWSQRNQARAALNREASARRELQKALGVAENQRSRADGEAKRANREASVAKDARAKADDARRKADDNAAQAHRQESLARHAEAKERAERRQKARLLYDADMQLAAQAWEQGATRRVKDLLEAHVPKPGGEDLRGFDWRYQWRLLNRNARVLSGHADGAHLGAFAPDGHLITLDADRQLRHWDLASGRATRSLSFASQCPLYRMALSHDGRMLAARTISGDIRLLDTATGRVRQVLHGHGPGAVRLSSFSTTFRVSTSLAFSTDNRWLMSLGAFDRTARVWDLSAGREAHRIEGLELETTDAELARDLTLSPDGTTLALAEHPFQDYQAILFNVRVRAATASRLRSFPTPGGTALSVRFSPDGKLLAFGDRSGFVTIVDLSTGKRLHQITAHAEGAYRIAYSPDGKTLATGSVGETLVKLWDVATGRQSRVLRGHTAPITFLAFSADGRRLGSGARDGTARVWDLTANPETRVLTGHTGIIQRLAYSPNGRLVATASWDRTVRLWDARAGRLLRTLPPQKSAVVSLAFSPDSCTLATGGFASEVMLWDLGRALRRGPALTSREGRFLGDLPASYRPEQGRPVGCLDFSPDARWLAAAWRPAGSD